MKTLAFIFLGFLAIPLIVELLMWLLIINEWLVVLVILCITGIIITNIVMKNLRRR
jgi:hypothetical protein